MPENVDNIILEQLRLIREDMRQIRDEMGEMRGDIADLKSEQIKITGVLMALGGYIRDIDVRVEHLEQKIGDRA